MTAWLSAYLSRPDALWALLIIPLLVFLWWRSARVRSKVLQHWSDHVTFLPVRRGLGRMILLTFVTMLVIALARPEWGTTPITPLTTARDLLVIVDVSQSMLAEDRPPRNRLTRAQQVLLDLLSALDASRSTARLGIIVFAGQARLLCPPTEDRQHLEQLIRELSTESLGATGRLTSQQTPIGTSFDSVASLLIRWAAENAQDREYTSCLILSDGDDLTARSDSAADPWDKVFYRIDAFAVGDPARDWPIPIGNSFLMISDPATGLTQRALTRRHDEYLASIAEQHHGTLIVEDNRPRPLVTWWERDLATAPARVLQSAVRQIPLQRDSWPLAAAGILLLIECALGGARRREW